MSENNPEATEWIYPFRGNHRHKAKAQQLCSELGIQTISELFRLILSDGSNVRFSLKIPRLGTGEKNAD